jgi:hypothetical protein
VHKSHRKVVPFPIGNTRTKNAKLRATNRRSQNADPLAGSNRTTPGPEDVEAYSTCIRAALKRSASAILETAALVSAARSNLDHTSFRKLAKMVGLSESTLSKFVSIHSNRHRFTGREDTLPVAWTVMYAVARLPDRQFDDLVKHELLQPKLTEKELSQFVSQRVDAAVGSKRAADEQAYFVVKIIVPALFDLGREDELRRRIYDAVGDDADVFITFSDRRKLESRR